jgi:tRNA(adenine34) deaminase
MTRLTVFERDTYSSIFCYLTQNVSIMKAAEERETDAHWMRQALAAACEARDRGEVPVGTAIVYGEAALAIAGNRTRTDNDPTAHAEIVALRAAAQGIGNYRLADTVVYSTIEPCVMCAGALIQARVRRLVYGARDERAGAVESRFGVCDTDFLNHRIEVTAGVLEQECKEVMQEFFRARRKKSKPPA